MNRILLCCTATAMLIVGNAPAFGQAAPPATPPSAQASKPDDRILLEQRVAALEAELARQTRIADNARQEMGAMRAEMKLKGELLALSRERNAQLYAIALEIGRRFVRSKRLEPVFQGDRVRMENLLQSYEDRLRAARIYESTLPPSVQQRMEAELGTAPGQTPAPADQN